MDSHGNICGVDGSNEFQITRSDGTVETQTNSFADGTMPKDLTKSTIGIFPRIATDIAAQLADLSKNAGSNDVSDYVPKFTQMCVRPRECDADDDDCGPCPQAGDVICNYKFLHTWAEENSALEHAYNPVTNRDVRKYMRITGQTQRELALVAPGLITNVCSGQTNPRMCEDVFAMCDRMPADSIKVLGRCIPYISSGPEEQVERCTEPLTDQNCSIDGPDFGPGGDREFNTGCIQDNSPGGDGLYYVPVYQPVHRSGSTLSYVLTDEGEANCVTLDRKNEQVSVIIPQASYLSALSGVASQIAQYMGDVQTAWIVVLLAGLVAPLAISLVYTFIMRCCATPMVWCAIFLFLIGNVALALLMFVKGGAVDIESINSLVNNIPGNQTSAYASITTSEDYAMYYQIAGWVLLFGAIVVLCMVIFARKAIQAAIHIIETAAKALSQMKTLALFPLVTFFGLGGLGAIFVVCGVLLLTAGDITESALLNSTATANATDSWAKNLAESYVPANVESSTVLNYMMIFDLFMFLWTTEFVQAIGIFTVGGAVSHWYFGADSGDNHPDEENTGQSHPCCCSYWIAIRFHTGSAAFGSLLIAIVTMIRVAFEYIDHKIRTAGEQLKARCLFKAISCMFRCCLCCLAQCMRFLSKQAYIHTAIHGDGFCFAAVRSYRLIFNNLLRFGATNSITAILMILGKVMVCLFSCLIGYTWVNYSGTYSDRTKETYVTSSLFISICILMLAYLVAEAFFNLFHVAIDAILLCYCMVSVLLLLLSVLCDSRHSPHPRLFSFPAPPTGSRD